jgi:hypothetical protein
VPELTKCTTASAAAARLLLQPPTLLLLLPTASSGSAGKAFDDSCVNVTSRLAASTLAAITLFQAPDSVMLLASLLLLLLD